MATFSTEYKQAFLESLADDADAQSISLLEALKAARSGRLTETKSGKVIVATAGNGHSVTFNTPSNGSELTPIRAAELCQELINRFRSAVDFTGAAATDATILAEMVLMLTPAQEAYADFSALRTHD